MTAQSVAAPLARLPALPTKFAGFALCLGLTVGAALLVVALGLWALVVPIYAVMLLLAVFRPVAAAGVLLAVAIVIEPTVSDSMKYLSAAVWALPPGFENALGITTSPIELLTIIAAVSSLRRPSVVQTPLITWAIPALVAMGIAYGLWKGGASNLAYHESRGFLVAIAMYVLASRTLPQDLTKVARLAMIAIGALAVATLARYFVYVRPGNIEIPIEFVFAHEGSVILGIGFVLGALTLLRHANSLKEVIGLSLYCLLIMAAMIATGRRAATLVLLVGGLTVAGVMLPKRTALVLALSIPMLLATSAYLAVYWNNEYGAAAQPARAIRSQFDPTSRDESSDEYRTTEKFNVIQTIRLSPIFGIGYGRPFVQFQPLPDLTSFWPLQAYTPHQSILWLWLKMGIVGISVVLGFALLVLGRTFRVLRNPASDFDWTIAAAACAGILMVLIYATVDLGFTGARPLMPAVILSVIALRLTAKAKP